jgi:orotate phosphoribosyltransferase
MTSATKNENLVEELKPYEDKWVALVDDKVVATGESPKEVAEKAEQAGHEKYRFYLVPSSSALYVL